MLTSLTHLKLSYNFFVKIIPAKVENLKRLELLHLQSNRLQGTLSLPDLKRGSYGHSSPTAAHRQCVEGPMTCNECSMCYEFYFDLIISCCPPCSSCFDQAARTMSAILNRSRCCCNLKNLDLQAMCHFVGCFLGLLLGCLAY